MLKIITIVLVVLFITTSAALVYISKKGGK